MPRQRHDPTKSLVGFRVGEVAYAVRIESVREVVHPLPVVALPRAAESVLGVASFRGDVVPVVDMRERFGLARAPSPAKSKWIIVDTEGAAPGGLTEGRGTAGRCVALAVDAVTGVFGTGGREIRPSPSLGEGADVRGVEGVVNVGESLVFVLAVTPFRAIAGAIASVRVEGDEGALGDRGRSA